MVVIIVVNSTMHDDSNTYARNTKALSVMMDSSMINTADATKLTAFVQNQQEDRGGTTCLTLLV